LFTIFIGVNSPTTKQTVKTKNLTKKEHISVLEELDKEQRKKKFEDLRRMPFSLNDDGNTMIFPTPPKKKRRKRKVAKKGKVQQFKSSRICKETEQLQRSFGY
jgi:hypothetical protein